METEIAVLIGIVGTAFILFVALVLDIRRRSAADRERQATLGSGSIPDLIALLAREDSTARQARAQLVAFGDQAVPTLIDALAQPNDSARYYATTALAEIGDAAVPGLRRALQSPTWYVRLAAADALGSIASPDAEPELRAAASDSHHKVRISAQYALNVLRERIPEMEQAMLGEDASDDVVYEPSFPASSYEPSAGPPAPTLSSLDQVSLFFWVFLDPTRLTEIADREGQPAIRRVMAWPVGTLIWLPLLIPIIGIDLGIFRNFTGQPNTLLLLHIAAVIGWVSFALVGSRGWQAIGPRLQSLSGIGVIAVLICSGAIIFFDGAFIALAFGAFGPDVGWWLLGSFLLAVITALGVAHAVSLDHALVVALPLAAALVYVGAGILGMRYIWLGAIGVVTALIYTGIGRLLIGTPDAPLALLRRLLVLAALTGSNILLIWILLFDGWWVLMGRPVFIGE